MMFFTVERMASMGLVLGIAGGFVALYYVASKSRDYIPSESTSAKQNRKVGKVYEDYSTSINNPMNIKNRFTKNGRGTTVVRGINEQDLVSWENSGLTYQIYRLPTVW